MGAFNNRLARAMKYALVWGSNSVELAKKVNEWLENHQNDRLVDMQVTETNDQYSVHIFYEEG